MTRRQTCWLTLFLMCAFAARGGAAEFLRVSAALPAADLDALFVRTNGWIGADGDYSVPVSAERTLWFFSDTWIGEVTGGRRTKAVLINNSVGVQTGRGAASRVEFFWGTNANGKPAALFQPADDHGWLWPFGGIMVSNRLHFFLWQMEKAEGPAAFGFRNAAVWHGEVANPTEAPSLWRVTQRKLPCTELIGTRRLLFGSAVLRHGEHVYIYGVEERPKERGFGRRMLLARVEASALGDFRRWRFWRDGSWDGDFRQATPLAPGMATEYSVTFVPALGRFVTVGHDIFLSPKIVARTAPQPWGPWSEPVTLYRCPEAAWNKENFCYAGKAHAQLSSADELVISYAANATQFASVLRDARLYWPKFIRVKVAGSPSASGETPLR